MSPNECLNNVILERTIEYKTTEFQNSTAKESNATSKLSGIEAHGKKDQSPPTHVLTCLSQVITCLSYGTSLLAVTIVNNYAVTCPCKTLAGWPFWCPTQGNQLCRVTGQNKVCVPLRRTQLELKGCWLPKITN